MSDIFISYSKADRELALRLSAFLEAEGWSVWWDKSLNAGETYRDEIMRQLASARAVITIWTENSVRSDWVRAEAGRAKADGKLIPTKAPALTYADIPLPFGEMHTENVTETHLIRAAVVAQLEKPAVQPSTLWLATRTVRLQVLTWAGIVGGAVTVFANLRGLFTLADWANWLVTNWADWTHALWAWTFAWMGIHLFGVETPLLSFIAFVAMTVIGTKLRYGTKAVAAGTGTGKSRNLIRFAKWGGVFTIFMLFKDIIASALFALVVGHYGFYSDWVGAILIIGSHGLPILVAILLAMVASNNRLQCFLTILLYFFFLFVLVVVPTTYATVNFFEKQTQDTADTGFIARAIGTYFFWASYVTSIGLIATVIMAPLRAVNSRLFFLFLGAVTLILLNEISDFSLQQYFFPK